MPRKSGMRAAGILAAAAALAAGAYAAMPSGSAARVALTAGTADSLPPLSWIVNANALRLLGQAGLPQPDLQRLFGVSRTFDVRPMAAKAPGLPGATPTVTFASYQAMLAAFNGPGLPNGIKAVLYDNEHWPLTPDAEQRDPAKYNEFAASLVHAHHLQFISAPAADLTDVLASGATDHYAAYLKLGLAADAARHADVIDIQAQGSEADQGKYLTFVRAAAEQARKANPHVVVLAGISTNPSGQHITAVQFTADLLAARPYVNGFWLNIPGGGAACPRCGTPQPQVAIPVLLSLSK